MAEPHLTSKSKDGGRRRGRLLHEMRTSAGIPSYVLAVSSCRLQMLHLRRIQVSQLLCRFVQDPTRVAPYILVVPSHLLLFQDRP